MTNTKFPRLAFLVATLSTLAPACSAQENQIFGLTIGKPVVIPICIGDYVKKKPTSGLCSSHPSATKENSTYTGPIAILFAPRLLPAWVDEDAGIGGISATLIDGALASAEIYTYGDEVKNVTLAALTEKYGKPSSVAPTTLQNNYGAEFTASTYRWKTAALAVEFRNIYVYLNKGLLRIETHEALALRNAEMEKLRQKIKQGERPL